MDYCLWILFMDYCLWIIVYGLLFMDYCLWILFMDIVYAYGDNILFICVIIFKRALIDLS